MLGRLVSRALSTFPPEALRPFGSRVRAESRYQSKLASDSNVGRTKRSEVPAFTTAG
ncbi:hypothetical protein RSSM_01673 [Rhodopirellula sallentina SM41]|uniref:Uncharacterized protein n=1 Tax=Rhodopirellula sallentina SM41 TaxID=1263870 RepID=M5ULK4_9BACT|nr:hypothetical protein RSSM_01673 [Rhodopirellula sallentina SM41]